jgi:hypothetical protein
MTVFASCKEKTKQIQTTLSLERVNYNGIVAELEAKPPADRDRKLRGRLVCAALTGLCADPSVDLDEAASKSAVAIADRTLAAMRKGGGA